MSERQQTFGRSIPSRNVTPLPVEFRRRDLFADLKQRQAFRDRIIFAADGNLPTIHAANIFGNLSENMAESLRILKLAADFVEAYERNKPTSAAVLRFAPNAGGKR